MRNVLLIATMLLLCFGLAAHADPVSRARLRTLVEQTSTILNEESLSDDSYRLDVDKGSVRYSVTAFDCNEEASCEGVMMFATWTMNGAPDLDMYEKINSYNDSYRYGRAFILPAVETSNQYAVGIDLVTALDTTDILTSDDFERFFDAADKFVAHMTE